MEFQYKINNSLDNRKSQFSKIMKNHPDGIPTILERAKGCTINKTIKTKYLLTRELTIAEFVRIIREKLEINPERALFFLVNGKHSLTMSEEMGNVYDKYKDKSDGFLYMTYSEEMVYG